MDHGTSGEIVAASSRLGPIELDLFGGGIRERFLKTNKKSRLSENDREAADAGATRRPGRAGSTSLGGATRGSIAAAFARGDLGRAVDAFGSGGAGRSWRRRRATAEKATPTTRETTIPVVA